MLALSSSLRQTLRCVAPLQGSFKFAYPGKCHGKCFLLIIKFIFCPHTGGRPRFLRGDSGAAPLEGSTTSSDHVTTHLIPAEPRVDDIHLPDRQATAINTG